VINNLSYNDVPKSLFILNLKCTGYDIDLYYYDEKLNILVEYGDGNLEYDYALGELDIYIDKIQTLRSTTTGLKTQWLP